MSESHTTLNTTGDTPAAAMRSAADAYPQQLAIDRPSFSGIAALRRVFSFPTMLGAILVGGAYVAEREFTVDPDCWWHIKTGEIILSTHHWPRVDPYSYTVAGQPWLSYEWGGDVVLALGARLGGLRGLEFLLILMAAAILVALYSLATVCSGNSKAGFVTSVTLFVLAVPSFSLRPQMLGYLFLIVTLIILERFRQGHRRAIWLLPPLFLLWVNTHGSWIIGLGTVAAYWMSGFFEFEMGGLQMHRWSVSDRQRISFAFFLSLCALPITPYGAELCMYPFQVASSLPISVANILEWQPMPFNMPGGKLFLALILGFIVLQVLYRFVWRVETLVLFLFGAAMATIHVRFLLLFVPFFAPVLVTIAARWVPGYNKKKDQHLANAVLIMACLIAMIYYFPTRADLQSKVATQFPVGAVDYLNRHDVPGPMLNTYGFGGYLVWSRGPEHKVFIDGRSELFEVGGVLNQYMQVMNVKPGALAVLHSYGIRSCLLDRNEPFATVLDALTDWKTVYSDHRSVIFVRRSAADPPAFAASTPHAGGQ